MTRSADSSCRASMLELPRRIARVTSLVVSRHESIAAQWAALILPAAFIYRIRASQEYPVLVLLLIALYATERSRRSTSWIAVLALAACTTHS